MGVLIGSDGLGLWVGNGDVPEKFDQLRGVVISRFEITQRVSDSNAIAADAWSAGVAISSRRMVIECEALATDEAPANRIRGFAMNGESTNIKLYLKPGEQIECSVFITRYHEIIQAGEIKRLQIRLESTGVASFA